MKVDVQEKCIFLHTYISLWKKKCAGKFSGENDRKSLEFNKMFDIRSLLLHGISPVS